MVRELKNRPAFFISIFSMLIVGLFFCMTTTKATCFYLTNPWHNLALDNFFINYTFLGDGWVSVAAVVVLLACKKYKAAFVLLLAFASSGLIAACLKNIFSLPRPKLYFEQSKLVYTHFIEQVTLSNHSSFPSGHTASAFAMATVFALLSNKKAIQILVLMLAVLVGYSRVYLGQHFLHDVIAGAFLGIICGVYSYRLIWYKQWATPKWLKKKYAIQDDIHPQWN